MKESSRKEAIDCLVDFVRTMPFEMNVPEIGNEIAALASYGAAWPKASATQWQLMIREALQSGLLVMNESGRVGPKIETAAKQLELF